jgi:hypothetical protein
VRKRFSELTLSDFDQAAIWTPVEGELLEPRFGVEELCAEDASAWVRFNAKLADDTPVRGIARAHCTPATLTDHLFIVEDERLPLSFSADGSEAEAFAAKLQRSVAHVFPIFIRAEIKAQSTGDVIAQELDPTGEAE